MSINTQKKQISCRLVTTIIPSFNRSELLVDALMSVLNQFYKPIEIIVVDDGSTDKTRLL
ncbi:MAG: glycosyltransferase family 2 protein, partial [Sphaerospermopsis kisseleviana]